jgi:hypothetical protein
MVNQSQCLNLIAAFTNTSNLNFCYTSGGVRVGLSRSDALKLAAQTVKGAAEMVLSTGLSPAVLKDQGAPKYLQNTVRIIDSSSYHSDNFTFRQFVRRRAPLLLVSTS